MTWLGFLVTREEVEFRIQRSQFSNESYLIADAQTWLNRFENIRRYFAKGRNLRGPTLAPRYECDVQRKRSPIFASVIPLL